MIQFIKRLFRRDSVRLLDVNPIRLTLDEWRTTPTLVAEAQRLLQSTTFKAMIEVMKNESPVHYQIQGMGAQPTDRITRLGHIEGYHQALNNLEAFAKPPDNIEPVQATFANPEREQL